MAYLHGFMVIALQVFFALGLILLIVLLVFRPKRVEAFAWPQNYPELLGDYVHFYANLNEAGKRLFEAKFERFLSAVKITGAGAEVEDLDLVLIGAAAVIPIFYIPDWEYMNLREILLYPGSFNTDFEQQGTERTFSGMVGSGVMENVMILSKWEVRQGFINSQSARNTALHEFVHLIDKMDGTSDINPYGAISPVECFAVLAEYFFEQPVLFRSKHPALHQMLQSIFDKQSKW